MGAIICIQRQNNGHHVFPSHVTIDLPSSEFFLMLIYDHVCTRLFNRHLLSHTLINLTSVREKKYLVSAFHKYFLMSAIDYRKQFAELGGFDVQCKKKIWHKTLLEVNLMTQVLQKTALDQKQTEERNTYIV